MVSGECSHSGQGTVYSEEWSGEWIDRVQSGEWREESAVRAGEEASGGEAPQLGITPQIHLVFYLRRLPNLSFVCLLFLLQFFYSKP